MDKLRQLATQEELNVLNSHEQRIAFAAALHKRLAVVVRANLQSGKRDKELIGKIKQQMGAAVHKLIYNEYTFLSDLLLEDTDKLFDVVPWLSGVKFDPIHPTLRRAYLISPEDRREYNSVMDALKERYALNCHKYTGILKNQSGETKNRPEGHTLDSTEALDKLMYLVDKYIDADLIDDDDALLYAEAAPGIVTALSS